MYFSFQETGGMRRSFKLIVDTHKLGDSSATSMQAISLENQFGNKHLPHVYGADNVPSSPSETESRMRILKDSSKDFLAPYNPTVETKSAVPTSSENEIANSAENEIVPQTNVLRTKLVGPPASSESLSFANHSVLLAAMGSVILFLALVSIYLLMRPVRKQVPVVVSPVDKQVLIQTEILPHHTALEPASVHRSSASASDQSIADQRSTLHV